VEDNIRGVTDIFHNEIHGKKPNFLK